MTDSLHASDRTPTLLGTVPSKLNLGSGKDFRPDCINVDVVGRWKPDIVADLNEPFPGDNAEFTTKRFGAIRLGSGMITNIVATDVLEHIADLPVFMTSCLELLQEGGTLDALVPYDLSHGAWQDPTHVRAFNERSWLYYTDWFWYLGWTRARFVASKLQFVLSDHGSALQSEGAGQDVLLRTPRAVDSMVVQLKKTGLTAADRQALARFTPAHATSSPL